MFSENTEENVRRCFSQLSSRCVKALLIVALLVPAQSLFASFQEVALIDEIERGLYIQGMFGSKVYLSPPVQEGRDAPRLMGSGVGIAAGFDVMDVLQLELFVMGAQIRAPADYGGLGTGADAHGDFSSVLAGVKARFAALALSDNQGVKRLHLSVHGGGGYSATFPSTFLESGRPNVLAGAGMYYFTRMRHFVIGLEVDAFYALGVGALALFPQARLSYTF